jgi:hypothetical protein
MNTLSSLKSDLTYIAYLTKAILEGLTTAPQCAADRAWAPVLTAAVWTPTAIGTAIGILGASFSRRNRSGYKVAVGGLLGSALGFGAGVSWTSRDFTGAVARSTLQKVNMVRDARWLEKNPIDYA